MKICFISTMGGMPWGGSEDLWTRAARHALECGHRVAMVTYRWPEVPPRIRELEERGACLYRMSRNSQRPVPRFSLSRLKRAYEKFVYPWGVLAFWKPERICVSVGTTFELLSRGHVTRFIKAVGAPYLVLSQHNFEDRGPDGEQERDRALALLLGARRVAFVSEHNLRVAERQLAADLPNACVVRNPVNLGGRACVPWPASDVVKMASVARLDAEAKGQDVLLQVLGGGDWRQRHWVLRLYGSGHDRPYLERLARRYEIADRVEFRGHVGDIKSVWADNHLLVLPSRSEGTPLSLVEAMVCARPSVVSDVGGNLEWVDEPSTGFIADAPSPRSFGEALRRAWEARGRWADMGRRAHEVATSRLDPHPERTLLSLLVDDGPTGLAPGTNRAIASEISVDE